MFTYKNNSYYLKPKFFIKLQSSFYNHFYEIKGLSKRLYIQTKRRPSNLITGLIQPLIWIILFGNLFQNLTTNLQVPYTQFLNTGMLIFTSFTSAINSGLPIIFDREFGFFNRLLVSPIFNRYSILISSLISILIITLFQSNIIIIFNILTLQSIYSMYSIIAILCIIILLTITIGNISICLALILPGHIEFLAFILMINLPVLFTSTALAPISIMPNWLKIIAYLNPITHAIELIRSISIQSTQSHIHIYYSFIIFITINSLNFIFSKYIITYKYE